MKVLNEFVPGSLDDNNDLENLEKSHFGRSWDTVVLVMVMKFGFSFHANCEAIVSLSLISSSLVLLLNSI